MNFRSSADTKLVRLAQLAPLTLIPALLLVAACKSKSGSELDGITGRTSMGARDPFQCYNLSYSGDEQVNGKWIAGADGTTFGSMRDGVITPQCGTTFTIRNIKTGQSAEFILVDRIWENDGVGGQRYGNKASADAKSGGIGPGYEQLDIAVAPFRSLFAGNNPGEGDYEIIGLGSGGSTLGGNGGNNGGPGEAPSSDPGGSSDGGCSYADAAQHGGWGWNEATKQSCPPQNGGTPPGDAGGSSAGGTSPGGGSGGFAESGLAPNGYPYCRNGSNNGDGWGYDESIDDGHGGHSCVAPSGPTAAGGGSASIDSAGAGWTPSHAAPPSCPGNQYCKGGWGWLAPGENGCSESSGGWKGNGCSCSCG
jgi:hypothetical protein